MTYYIKLPNKKEPVRVNDIDIFEYVDNSEDRLGNCELIIDTCDGAYSYATGTQAEIDEALDRLKSELIQED